MITTLDRLDQRKTTYRFDLSGDIPWSQAGDPGVRFPDALLARLGFSPEALSWTPGARASIDTLMALSTSKIFSHLERDVIRFVAAEGARRPSKSAQMLVEEEEKHVDLFTRVSSALSRAHPREADALDRVFVSPPSFDRLSERARDYASEDEVAFTFWLNTIFFEEYTVWFHCALEEEARAHKTIIQPAWLAAHRCHRQEETQHVLTDAAYLDELALDATARRRLSKSFFLFLDQSWGSFFGVDAAARALATLHPNVAGLPASSSTFRELPLFRELIAHPAFKHTRRAAPYLKDIVDDLGDKAPRARRPSVLHGGAAPEAPAGRATLWSHLERAAETTSAGVTFVPLDTSVELSPGDALSYRALIAEARARLGAMRERGARPGDFVMLLTALPSTTVPWLWACAAGGLVAVPLALPTTADDAEEMRRLLRIHGQLGAPFVVCDDATAPIVAGALPSPTRILQASARGDGAAPPHAGRADDVFMLQYSSGSLGDPRGVVLTHANLLGDIRAMLARRASGDEVFVSWMPLFHDMGLIGYHLTPVVAGMPQLLMSPLSFMREPLSWLHALSKHKATITGAPNFALARLVPRLASERGGGAPPLDLNLSTLHTFLVGAEPISMSTLDAFASALAPYGLRADALCPAYGLAEATLAVTMVPRGERPRAISVSRPSLALPTGVVLDDDDDDAMHVVDLGVPLPGLSLRITSDAGDVVDEGVVGAIELSGTTVSSGYHAAAAAKTHAAAQDERWLDTGDLGLVLDGRLFITGRKKDVFFVGGRNFYANDVEAVARELPFLHPGAVALVVDWNESWGVDDLALFVALRPDVSDRSRALADVHAHVARRVGVSVGRVIEIDKRRMPRTTSGKLKRRALLERLRDGAFESALAFLPAASPSAPAAATAPAAAPRTRVAHDGSVVDVVRAIWADVLERPLERVGPDDNWRAIGGDSFRAVRVHDRVESAIGCAFTPELLAVGTTPRRMATFIELARPSGDDSHAHARARLGDARARPAPVDDTSAPRAGPTSTRERAGERAGERADAGARDAEIAIVALAVRAPDAQTPAELWRLLVDGRCTIGELPAARVDEAMRLGLGGELDRALTRGSWFDDVANFDPAPFDLSDAEARAMGPAQRLFLEVAFEALAGAALTSRRVGVFAGAGADGYAQRYADDPALVTGHSLLGALPNMVAARAARAFGLTGPALTIDTACSSSLAAVHLACESLRRGECEVAVAGGVQVGLSMELLLSFRRAGLLSADGRARPFDEGAAGLVPGEAAGAVALKLRSEAERCGDRIWAVIAGSAMNNDGGALSGTAPSPTGQREVITRAWSNARQPPAAAAYVEAHAAGTAVGDAVEVRALSDALMTSGARVGEWTARDVGGGKARACAVGSIKGNLGHTLAAAGIMSLAKTILALRHRQAPPTAGLARPASRIDFDAASLAPAMSAPTPLVAPRGGVLFAGVSSFGLGGTNVHVVLAEAPRASVQSDQRAASGPTLFCFGAPNGQARRVATHLRDVIRDHARSDASLVDLAAGAAGWAALLPERRAFVVEDRAALVAALDDELRGARASPTPRGKLAFVLPGPGSQVPGMGRALFEAHPAFREALSRCSALARRADVDLLALMFAEDAHARGHGDAKHGEPAPIHRLQHAQPVVFSFGYALACWLAELGVRPDVLIGHSAGEYVAAHLAGMISLDDALALVIARGRAMAAAAPGRMAAVLAPREDVERALASFGRAVVIAANNAPEQVAISGARDDVDAACAALAARGMSVRPLDIDCAAHSGAVKGAAQEFIAAAATVRFLDPRDGAPPIVVSSTTADVLHTLDARHLERHLTSPVEFVGAVRRARDLGVDAFVELGATAGLSSCVRQILADDDSALVAPFGVRGEPELVPPAHALAALVEAGFSVCTSMLLAGRSREWGALSADVVYPYERRRLWIDARPRTLLPMNAHATSIELSPTTESAIRDHRTGGVASAPAALLLDLLVDALKPELGAVDLHDVVVLRPLSFEPDEVRAIEVVVDPDHTSAPAEGRARDLRIIRSRAIDPPANAHIHMRARPTPARGRVAARLDLGEIRARTRREVRGESVYALLDATGFVMGPTMRAVESVKLGEAELLARLVAPKGASRGRRIDPALLDGASHAVAAFFLDDAGAARGPRASAMYLGFTMESVRFHRPVHDTCYAYVRLRAPPSADAAVIRYDIALLGGDGELLAEIDDFGSRRVNTGAPASVVSAPPAPAPAGAAHTLSRIASAPPAGARADIVEIVRGLVAARLRRPPTAIAEHAPLARLGVDSLMAVELVKKLEERLAIKLYATLFFEATTIAAVADRIHELMDRGGDR